MDKQAHLRHRRSGEQKGIKRGLAGAGTPKCQAGWRAAECTECAAPSAGLPTRLGFHFLAPSEATPEMSPQPLSALPKHAHTTPAFGAFCVSSASSEFVQCHSGKGGGQCQSVCQPRCWPPGEPESLPLVLLLATGGPWAGWMGSEPTQDLL